MAKSEQRIRARTLRKAGGSIKQIAKELSVSVSSVSLWCRDIKLTAEQIKQLEKQAKDPLYGKRLEYILFRRKELDRKIKKLKNEGIKDVGILNNRDLFLVGVALYWSEGFKKDSQAGFANSSPEMIRLFLRWLFECCGYGVDDLSLRVTVNISHKERIDDIQRWWSEATGVPVEKFQKSFYQNVKWKKIYEHPDEYFGVLRVKVRKSTDFLRKIHGWIEGLSLQT